MPIHLPLLEEDYPEFAKRSIDARNQPLRATAIVFVIGSKSHAKRYLFNMDAIQHSQCSWNQDNGKTGPGACVKRKCKEDQFHAEIGRMTDQGVETRTKP
jgi:hypothetical protein